MNESTKPQSIKRKQKRNLIILIIIIGINLLGLYILFRDQSSLSIPVSPKDETVPFATPLHVNQESIWVERAQNQLLKETKENQGFKQQLQLLQQSKDSQDQKAEQQQQTLQDLQKQVTLLQQQLNYQSNHHLNQLGSQSQVFSLSPENREFSSSIRDERIPLKTVKSLYHRPLKNPDTFVPAGTFVRAIALGGADASTGVTSQANPTPMLFRLLDQGTLPNHHQSHLKNCFATAAVIGDISSERGNIRLERLSCVHKGEVVEIPVEATIFGPDGKDGVRGNPLWREGRLLKRAFAAGTLSGISSGIAQSFTSQSLTPWGGAQAMIDNGKILQYGVANGLGNAAEKLADYNIKRAEQYHPVIQLSAGTVVDIVFLKGFYLNGKIINEGQDYLSQDYSSNKISNINDTPDAEEENSQEIISRNVTGSSGNSSENSVNSDTNRLSPLPLTPEQIQKLQKFDQLKQKNNEQGYF